MRSAPAIALSVLAAALFAVATTAASDLPRQWQLTADGLEGELRVLDETQGRIEATVLARPAVGFRAGAVVVLLRQIDGAAELWQGRLGHRPDGLAFLSGTISSGSAVAPFFAVEMPGLAAPRPTPSKASHEGTPAPTPGPVSAPVVPLVPTPQPVWSGFEGPWSTPDGAVMVVRDGSSIEVTMPDNSVCEGRMTGDTTFVVGLRVACCRGELEGPDTIRWCDTTVWKRAE